MSTKIIAIGNQLMGDDGIAIHIAEELLTELTSMGIEMLLGETDFMYCLTQIEEDDFIVLLDATWLGFPPGTVTVHPFKELYDINQNQSLFSQHGYSLPSALRQYGISVDGILIGIEGSRFDFDLSLSPELEIQFENLCRAVKEFVSRYADTV